jgi:hypothetical protein
LACGPGAIEAQRRQRVDLAVDFGDPLFQHVEQIERRDFAELSLSTIAHAVARTSP